MMENWTWPPTYDDSYLPPSNQLYWFPSKRPWIPSCVTSRSFSNRSGEYATDLAGDEAGISRLDQEAAEALRRGLGVSTRVSTLPQRSLDRTEFTARRVIDQRDLFREVLDQP